MAWGSEDKLKVGIVGANGYVGGELMRLLLGHPKVELTHVISRSQSGLKVGEVYPQLARLAGGLQMSSQAPEELVGQVDLLFLALPHGVSMEAVASLFGADGKPKGGLKVIDMSGDFRLPSAELYEAHYGKPHSCPELLGSFVYGLSEWAQGSLAGCDAVANPGCFATAIELGLAPLAAGGWLPEQVTVFAATGSTGSGATPKSVTHHPVRASNYKIYKILSHQHQPEIESTLEGLGQAPKRLSFIPASAPMARGIFATIHMQIEDAQAAADAVFAAYEGKTFVNVVQGSPQLHWVVGSNDAQIGVTVGEGELVVAVAIDNMLKGAAGQGVQNMNLMMGFEESEGLGGLSVIP